jgi:2,3-bisphosphoglycerate-independent phosphoglycerate mutase
MGNSEVGHQNIGAGRIVDQEIVRINKALANGTLAANPVLQAAFSQAKKPNSKLHFMGLVSDGGVHAMSSHLYGLIALAKDAGVQNVFIHAFTDGRDTPPLSGLQFISELEQKCAQIGIGKIASICGRFWAMDRDNRWDRIQKAYDCIIGKKADHTSLSATKAIQYYYDHPLDSSRRGDEFIVPTIISNNNKTPIGPISDGDSVIFFNYRGDRPRELTRAFIDNNFTEFDRGPKKDLFFATLTNYEDGLCSNVILERPPKMINILGQVVSAAGIKQFRCAETEKYPHVTFFFNDYREEPFPGEDRVLIPSPRSVSTYDQIPQMSAEDICEATKKAILSKKYGLIVVNFANADMVGHSGSLETTITAVETVDKCIGILLQAIDKVNGVALITADHGNADQMWNPSTGSPHTQHTLNPVELVLYGHNCQGLQLRSPGLLADIAPTILHLMGLSQPKEMTGTSLII